MYPIQCTSAGQWQIGGANVLFTDVQTKNGAIHVIDRVLTQKPNQQTDAGEQTDDSSADTEQSSADQSQTAADWLDSAEQSGSDEQGSNPADDDQSEQSSFSGRMSPVQSDSDTSSFSGRMQPLRLQSLRLRGSGSQLGSSMQKQQKQQKLKQLMRSPKQLRKALVSWTLSGSSSSSSHMQSLGLGQSSLQPLGLSQSSLHRKLHMGSSMGSLGGSDSSASSGSHHRRASSTSCVFSQSRTCSVVDTLSSNSAWLAAKANPAKLFSASNEPSDISCVTASSNPQTSANRKDYSRSGFSSQTVPVCFMPQAYSCTQGKLIAKVRTPHAHSERYSSTQRVASCTAGCSLHCCNCSVTALLACRSRSRTQRTPCRAYSSNRASSSRASSRSRAVSRSHSRAATSSSSSNSVTTGRISSH